MLHRHHALRLLHRRSERRYGLMWVHVFRDDGRVLEVGSVGKESAIVCVLGYHRSHMHHLLCEYVYILLFRRPSVL